MKCKVGRERGNRGRKCSREKGEEEDETVVAKRK
jgi:hypothetical protein